MGQLDELTASAQLDAERKRRLGSESFRWEYEVVGQRLKP
jgi:hypothetical protein